MIKKMIPTFFLIATLLYVLALAYSSASEATEATSDSVIVTKIKSQINNDPLLSDSTIAVSSIQGKVSLSGKVDTDTQYERAIMYADNTPGVVDIDAGDLKVKNSQAPLTDTYITAKVKGTLLKEKIVKGNDISAWSIHVETKDGVVFLTGTVSSQAERNRVDTLVSNIEGVKSVKDNLSINQ